MKKLIMTVAAFACVASIVSAQVYSANAVGYVKRARPAAKYTILGNNFKSTYLDSVVGTDGKGFFISGQADLVYTYTAPSGPYSTYFLYDNGTVKEWRSTLAPMVPAVVPVNNGDALFYQAHSAATVLTNTCLGDVSDELSVTNNIQIGLQLISYPFNADATLNSMGFSQSGKAKGFFISGQADKIYVYDPNKLPSAGYNTYFLYDNTVVREWRDTLAPTTTPLPPVTIPQGQGFFYETSPLGGAAFQYIDARPYAL